MTDRTIIQLGGKQYPLLGRGEYDAIIFGLGFRECLVASLLIKAKKRVLIISKKQSFTWDNTSFDLLKLFRRYREEEPTEEDFESLGSNKDYHIDLIPKVILSYGKMMSLFREIGLEDRLSLETIHMHMAYSGRNKRVYKLPSSPEDANRSNLLSMIQRMHCKTLLQVIEDRTRHSRSSSDSVLIHSSSSSHPQSSSLSMEDVYEKYGISEGSRGFLGHGMALYGDEEYLEEAPKETCFRIRQYMKAVTDNGSPFVYPCMGKQQLCNILRDYLEEKTEYCDIMLQQLSKQLVFENDSIAGVVVGEKAARAPVVIGDSTWFRDDRQKKIGKVVRSICILNHPIEGCESGASCVIGFFKKQLVKAGYKVHDSDINALCLSWKMKVCPKGIYVVILSTTVETQKAIKELKPATDLLGNILEQFDSVTTLYRNKKATRRQGIHIFRSLDASVTLESVAEDVLDIVNSIVPAEEVM